MPKRLFLIRVWDEKLKKHFNVKVQSSNTRDAKIFAEKVVEKYKHLFSLVEGNEIYAIQEREVEGIGRIYPSYFFVDDEEI